MALRKTLSIFFAPYTARYVDDCVDMCISDDDGKGFNNTQCEPKYTFYLFLYL